ncbi:MAG TPA: hypothetical protein VEW42_04415 [Candidatus Eisenbacteria bacterium]|nr:hypothetical protein [Candidatus Eisenbacteria bacterium]
MVRTAMGGRSAVRDGMNEAALEQANSVAARRAKETGVLSNDAGRGILAREGKVVVVAGTVRPLDLGEPMGF